MPISNDEYITLIMKILIKTLRTHWLIILFLLFYVGITAYKLISHPTPFFDWDESIYMQVGREMIHEQSLIPLWQGQVWLEKPPLVPAVYGLIMQLPVEPEISTRLFTLILAVFALFLIYIWIRRITNSTLLATVTAIVTAFNPLFLQKAQTANTDLWLLIGIIGYLLTYPRPRLSFFFLFIGVFSKSLLGFYPAILLGLFELYTHIKRKDSLNKVMQSKHLRLIAAQVASLLSWYVLMIFMFGNQFIQVHFIDHLARRVTSSIEFHFGKRTFYLDMVVEQYGWFVVLMLVSIGIFVYRGFKKKETDQHLFHALFLVPYFIFLNLTKTKIGWYLFPVIPQAAFLTAYPLLLLKKFRPIFIILGILVTAAVLYTSIESDKFFTSYFSQVDDNYRMATYARTQCSELIILVDKDTRESFQTLEDLGLLISTSRQYANHPAIVYYFDRPVDFVYNEKELEESIQLADKEACIVVSENDTSIVQQIQQIRTIKHFGPLYLFKLPLTLTG